MQIQKINNQTSFGKLGNTMRYLWWLPQTACTPGETITIANRQKIIRVTKLLGETIRIEKYNQKTDSSIVTDLKEPKFLNYWNGFLNNLHPTR